MLLRPSAHDYEISLIRRKMLLATAAGLLAGPGPSWAAGQADAKEVVVGQLAALSNPANRVTAMELQAGVEMALRQINAKGGVQGRSVRVVVLDDDFNPSKTVALAQELVQQHGALALVGCLGTQTTLRLIREHVLERSQLASFGPFTGLREVQSAPHIFPVRLSFDDEARAMFFHAVRLGRRNICFLYLKAGAGPDLSRSAQQWADEAGARLLHNTGLEIGKTESEQRQACEAALAAWGGDAPDAVVLIGFGAAQSNAIATLRKKYRVRVPIYALGQVNTDTLIAEVGLDAARGVTLTQVMPSPLALDRQICREYAAARQRWHPELKSTYMMLEGYVAARVMLEVMQRAKTLTREGVLEAALGAGEMGVADFRVSYSPAVRKSLQPVDITMLNQAGVLIR
jgi:branched-chain amino acid transport system substrate-binding protein